MHLLLNAGCDFEKINDDGNTPAHIAAIHGNDMFLRVLKYLKCDLQKINNDGNTPAYIAAVYGYTGCIRVLMEAGCNLGKARNDGLTPAHAAAQNGHIDCLYVLRDAGCNLEQNVIVILVVELLHLLLRTVTNHAYVYYMMLGVTSDRQTMIVKLLQALLLGVVIQIVCVCWKNAGCDLGQTVNYDRTPAHKAAQNGHIDCLRVLKDAGCDLEHVDEFGFYSCVLGCV